MKCPHCNHEIEMPDYQVPQTTAMINPHAFDHVVLGPSVCSGAPCPNPTFIDLTGPAKQVLTIAVDASEL